MGFFDSSSTSVTTSTTNVADKRLVADNGSLGVSGDNTIVNVTDAKMSANALENMAVVSTYLADTMKAVSDSAIAASGSSASEAIAAAQRSAAAQDALAKESMNSILGLGDSLQKTTTANFNTLLSSSRGMFETVVDFFGNTMGQEFELMKGSQAAVGEAYAAAKRLENDRNTLDNRYLIAGALGVIGVVAVTLFRKKS